jgi:16S rRNA (uracil1498-N3)-methyltransferase
MNRESPLHITIAQALLRGSKMDLIIQKLTELGVTTYIPFWTQRSVPKLDLRRAESRHRRWTNIAYETLKQCGRGVAPEIKPLSSFDEIIRSQEEYELKMIYCPKNADRSQKYILDDMPRAHKVIGVIGPEGGFTSEETRAARDCGYVRVSLGPRVLRSETAAVTAAAILQYVYGDLGA